MAYRDNQKDTNIKEKWISKLDYTRYLVQECDNQEILRSFQARNHDSLLRMRPMSNFVDHNYVWTNLSKCSYRSPVLPVLPVNTTDKIILGKKFLHQRA